MGHHDSSETTKLLENYKERARDIPTYHFLSNITC